MILLMACCHNSHYTHSAKGIAPSLAAAALLTAFCQPVSETPNSACLYHHKQ